MNYLFKIFNHTVNNFGERNAINYNYNEYTYNNFWNLINSIEDKIQFVENGVVVVQGKNSINMLVCIYAAFKNNCVVVPLHENYNEHLLRKIINEVNPVLIIIDTNLFFSYANLYNEMDNLIYSMDGILLKRNSGNFTNLANYNKLEECVLIMYSSGSTGEIKGIICPYSSISYATSRINSMISNNMTDIILITSKFSFDYGLYQCFLAFEVGAEVVINDTTDNMFMILEVIEKCKVTGWAAVPIMIEILIKTKRFFRQCRTLKYITSTGDILKTEYIDCIIEKLPNTKLFSMYGLTECKRVSILSSEEYQSHRGSVGKPLPGTMVRIVNDNGNDVESGEYGELVVYGNHIMNGYYKDEELSNHVFQYNYSLKCKELHTGDIFCEKDGYLYFISRTQLFIKKRGIRIAPFEIEEEIQKVEGIKDVIVIPIHNKNEEDEIFAFIHCENNYNKEKCYNNISQNVKVYYIPEYLYIEKLAFPLNVNGKIDRIAMALNAERIIRNEYSKN